MVGGKKGKFDFLWLQTTGLKTAVHAAVSKSLVVPSSLCLCESLAPQLIWRQRWSTLAKGTIVISTQRETHHRPLQVWCSNA